MIKNVRDPNPGGSPAVYFLHGLGADSESWQYQLDFFSACGMRPLAPDIPGFGKAAFSGKKWNLDVAVEDTVQNLLTLHTLPANIVGISMGGAIALAFVLKYPQYVKKLVLVNTFACIRPHHITEFVYLLRRYLRARVIGVEGQANLVAWRIFPDEEDAALRNMLYEKIINANQKVYKQAMRSLAFFDVRNRLVEIKKPTLVISGQDDTTIDLEIQEELANGIPGAQRVIIPGGGHAISIDQPQQFNEVLFNFFHSGN